MSVYLRSHLGAKLLLSYLVVIVAGMIVLILTSQSILPASFNRHMGGMMGPGSGMMGMGGQGFGSPNAMSQLYLDYRASFDEALMYAGLAAMAAAILLSIFLSRSVTAPVRDMSLAAQHIAEGHYDERVQVRGSDELAQLAMRFNQMAMKLDQVESMRRRLIGDVSHELRTPLTAIKGSMEGLMDGILPAKEETYQQIQAEADRLNRLVDDLQELSRVEARAYELDIRSLEASTLIRAVMKRLSPQAEFKRITLELELASDRPRILADEDRTIQVLTNLIGNAIQYTLEGGKIIVAADRVDNELQFSVRDTGIGVSSEHLPQLFDRFYRVDRSRSRRSGGGSGIGLTIARSLVEAQGGRIWVESRGEGQGSTFRFTLPIAK